MKKKITITYNWSNAGGTEIPANHQEALEESAMDRILKMQTEGYTSGELHDNIRMTDEDGEDGIEYSGWWEMTTETL